MGVLRRVFHRFLVWAPPAALGSYLVILSVVATAAPVNTDAKELLDNQITMLRAVSNAPYLTGWIIFLVLLWLLLYLWTNEREAAPAQVPSGTNWVVWIKDVARNIFHKDMQADTKPQAALDVKQIPAPVVPDLLPLPDAAKTAFDELRYAVERLADHQAPWTDPEKLLGLYAHLLVNDNAVPLWGVYPPSDRLRIIPDDDAAKFQFSRDASEMSDAFDANRRWINLQLPKEDFDRRLGELKRQYAEYVEPDAPDQHSQALGDQDRAPCISALDELEKFISNELSQVYELLRPASNLSEFPRQLMAQIQNHASYVESMEITTRGLLQRNSQGLQLLGVDATDFQRTVAGLVQPAKGVFEAKLAGWSDNAVRDRLRPLARANEEMKVAADRLQELIHAKREEHDFDQP